MGEAAKASENRAVPVGLIPWKPGQSGNPGGRPKGLASYIRESTLDGRELADFLMEVMRGQTMYSKVTDRLKACEMLMDRAFGKQFAPEPGNDKNLKPILPLSKLTAEELLFLENVRAVLSAIGRRIGEEESAEKAAQA